VVNPERRLTKPVAYFAGVPAARLEWGTFPFDGHFEALEESLEQSPPTGAHCAPA
jgi:hypothetical protein